MKKIKKPSKKERIASYFNSLLDVDIKVIVVSFVVVFGISIGIGFIYNFSLKYKFRISLIIPVVMTLILVFYKMWTDKFSKKSANKPNKDQKDNLSKKI